MLVFESWVLMLRVMKITLLMVCTGLLLFLSGCAKMHPPLQTVLKKDIRHIDVAALEFDHKLRIRRFTPLLLLMGSSGMLLENFIVATQGYQYAEKAGNVGLECSKAFKSTLIHRLQQAGYIVHDRNERYKDYFKSSRKAIREQTDAILRIKMKQIGFWSDGVGHDYHASALILAELIEPAGRNVIYRNRFVIGISPKNAKLLKEYFGETELVTRSDKIPSFRNFKTLLANPEESRFDLLNVMAMAARKISNDLRPNGERTIIASGTSVPLDSSAWLKGLNPSGDFQPTVKKRPLTSKKVPSQKNPSAWSGGKNPSAAMFVASSQKSEQ